MSWNYGLPACNHDTCQNANKGLSHTIGAPMGAERRTISTETRGHLTICRYMNPLDKENVLQNNFGHPLSELDTRGS